MMNKRHIGAIAVVGVIMMAWCVWMGWYFGEKSVEPVVVETTVIKENNMDTSAIDFWCSGYSDGKVRMMGAVWYADGVVIADDGQLWATDLPIKENDFLLLWIADNHTPDNILDDVIIKTWAEVY